MEIIDVKHIILESKAEMCIYGLLNLKQNGINLSFSKGSEWSCICVLG
jgi:hypothetical protein